MWAQFPKQKITEKSIFSNIDVKISNSIFFLTIEIFMQCVRRGLRSGEKPSAMSAQGHIFAF